MVKNSSSVVVVATTAGWETVRLLGKGGCGTVHLAVDPASGHQVAVKTVLCDTLARRDEVENEVAILQSLQEVAHVDRASGGGVGSSHIIKCHGAITVEGTQPVKKVFLEYMEGGSLEGLVQEQGCLLESEARVFARAILKGLDFLHAQGIVHGDVKCANVLLGPSSDAGKPDVKLADFGISRRFCTSASSNKGRASVVGQPPEGGVSRGTLSHMAPELGPKRGPSPASDVWSFGCTVVEMLQAGCPPWGHGVEALVRQVVHGEAPCLPPSLSPICKDFVLNCLRPDPDARWTANRLLRHPFLMVPEDISQQLTNNSTPHTHDRHQRHHSLHASCWLARLFHHNSSAVAPLPTQTAVPCSVAAASAMQLHSSASLMPSRVAAAHV